jgi:hypothetical protein
MHQFLKFILEGNSIGFGQFLCPLSEFFTVNLYDIYHCCVYSEKLLMMDSGTVQNM